MRKEGKYRKAKQHTASRTLVAVVLCAAVLFSLSTGTAVARYLVDLKTSYGFLTSPEFYFTSDYLSEEGKNYTVLCSDLKSATIDFQLFNYTDELNYSKEAIQYTVQYELKTIKKTKSGTIPGGSQQTASVNLNLLTDFGLNAFAENAVVKVTAQAESPYRKALNATFTLLHSENAPEYSVSDSSGSNAGTVTVTTGGAGGTLTVTLPQGCIFDPTGTYPGGSTPSGSSLSFQANPDAEYAFVYLKKDPQASYVGNVTVMLTQ